MLGWLKEKRYRDEVMNHVIAAMPGLTASSIFSSYPGTKGSIREAMGDQPAPAKAVFITTSILTDVIGQLDDERRLRIANGLNKWVSDGGKYPTKEDVGDAFQLRLQLATIYITNACDSGLIEEGDQKIFLSEVFGALSGKSSEQRTKERMHNLIEELIPRSVLRFGDDDNSKTIRIDLPLDLPEKLTGVQVEVKLVSTPTGIVMVDAETNQQITLRRSLTQEDLGKVPQSAKNIMFVNLPDKYEDNSSCLIYQPDTQIIGSGRAFWWSLSCKIVRDTLVALNLKNLSVNAYGKVFREARAMWEVAIEEAKGIDNMRDMLVPLRNVHFEVVRKMQEKEPSEAGKLGFDVALAMLMATQSEDPLLERFAYRHLKQFMWHGGEEPNEFYRHDDVTNSPA